MKQVAITKEIINKKFEHYFIHSLLMLSLVLFLNYEHITRGRLSFVAFLMLCIYVPAIIWIYLTLFSRRVEIVTHLEKRFIGINITLILVLAVVIYFVGHPAFFMVSNIFYQVTGISALIGGFILLFRRIRLGVVPLFIYFLLTLCSWRMFIDPAILIWFIIFTCVVFLFIHETSVIIKFNKDLKHSGIMK